MEDTWKKFGLFQALLLTTVLVGMLWAFPLMWAWNYTITYLFGLPTLTWLHAWLLWNILAGLWRINTVSIVGETKK